MSIQGQTTRSAKLATVDELIVAMTLEEKPAQLVGLWEGRGGRGNGGDPYSIGWATERCAAVVQSFFPGQEGAQAVTGVLTGRVNPSGRPPMSLPSSPGGQPYSYLHPPQGGGRSVSNLDTAPVAALGHGLSYTTFDHEDFPGSGTPATGQVRTSSRSTGRPQHAVSRGLRWCSCSGSPGVELEPRQAAEAELRISTTRLAYTGIDLRRVVEPGEVALSLGTSCADLVVTQSVRLTGEIHEVTTEDARLVSVAIDHEE